jgi:hypothetical protein
MPSHNHDYEKFCHTSCVSFDASFGYCGYYPRNLKNDNSPSKFLYTYSTTSVGGGGSHNNMPPFLTANCWKRTG